MSDLPPGFLDTPETEVVYDLEGAPEIPVRDPFAEPSGPDPFAVALDSLGWESLRLRPTASPIRPPATRRLDEMGIPRHRAQSPARARSPKSEPKPAEVSRIWPSLPPLAEIEPVEPVDLLDRFLGEEERRRVSALSHLVAKEAPYDRFGFSPSAARRGLALFLALYRYYFRVQSHGHEHLPGQGPVVLVGNHAGLLPFDAAMAVVDVFLNTDPPRLARAIVDRWAGTLPWINIAYARMGQVIGTRENFSDLLDDGQAVLVFPEGIDGVRKRITQRYRLQRFRVGFIEEALRARATIVPMAVIGSENQAPVLFDVKPLARRLGLPVVPITPTFPWFGPLGLLPYPVRYHIVYGEPLNFQERFGPEGAEDSRLVRYLANHVRRNIQLLIDQNR